MELRFCIRARHERSRAWLRAVLILDELAIERVDVVKLDIEGAEVGALQGLIQRLTSGGSPVIVFEFADLAETRIAGQAARDAQEFLLSLGYSLFRLVRGGGPGELPTRPLTTGSTMILALPPVRRVAAKD